MRCVAGKTIPAVLMAAAERWGAAPAIIEGDSVLSFTALAALARAACSAFIRAGVGRGGTVGIWAPNSAAWVAGAVGAQMAGAAIVPLNTRLKGREAGEILRRARVEVLLTVGDFLGTDYPALLREEFLPALRRVVRLDAADDTGWQAFLASGAGEDDDAVDRALADLRARDVCDIMFTSGTTGQPKGVVHTHASVIGNFVDWAECVDLRRDDRYVIANPFFHSFGYKAGWLACLLTGATAYPLPVFDVTELCRLVMAAGISFLPGPPTIFHALLAEHAEGRFPAGRIRVAVTGAAPVAATLVRRMWNELGIGRVVNGYGMTECGAIALTRAADDADAVAATCGAKLPGLEVRCVNDSGEMLGAGEAGEILVRGRFVMRGYLDDPEATAEAIDADGWLHTGDIGVLDQQGRLSITDRKKDMFISGGFNCYPAEIERLLCAHEAVEAAAVIGVADARLGEVGRAFIVLRTGRRAAADEILAWAQANMANYKVPRSAVIVPELPRNASNKVQKALLRGA